MPLKVEEEQNNWEIVKKHPITKVVLIVGVTFGLLYASSFLFDATAKAATSFGNLKRAIQRNPSV